MAGPLIVSAVVRDGDIYVTDPAYKARRQVASKKWGDGCALTIRVEPEDEAWRHADAKWLYGYLYTPACEQSGETVPDMHLRLKVLYFPEDGRSSLTELNREEFKQFVESVEQDIRENQPDAWEHCVERMALFERRRA